MKGLALFLIIMLSYVSCCCISSNNAPILLGKIPVERLLEELEGYKARAILYDPDPEAIKYLHSYGKPLTIEVFFGSWCPDCREHLPHFVKIIQEAANPNISTIFIGVSRDKSEPVHLLQGKRVEFVPTFIVYREDKEIGRIVEHPRISIEHDIVVILKERKPLPLKAQQFLFWDEGLSHSCEPVE